MGWNPFKDVGKAVSGAVKSVGKIFDDPVQTAMYIGGAALIATGFGAPLGTAMMIGGGVGVAASGALGKSLQDVATMGASAQTRYNQKMTEAYNQAAKQQALIAEETNRQNLLQQIRAARIARSMNLADYAGETGVTSSGALGNLSSIGSQYLSNLGYSVRTGQAANAYQTYMNQYNQYQAKAQNSAIKWNNRMNMVNTALSLYGMGNSLQTSKLQNEYARKALGDAWDQAYSSQAEASSVPHFKGEYLSI